MIWDETEFICDDTFFNRSVKNHNSHIIMRDHYQIDMFLFGEGNNCNNVIRYQAYLQDFLAIKDINIVKTHITNSDGSLTFLVIQDRILCFYSETIDIDILKSHIIISVGSKIPNKPVYTLILSLINLNTEWSGYTIEKPELVRAFSRIEWIDVDNRPWIWRGKVTDKKQTDFEKLVPIIKYKLKDIIKLEGNQDDQ